MAARRKKPPAPSLEGLEPPAEPVMPVVAIGASAGAVKALQDLFEALPDKVGAAFVVVIHLDPHAHSELAEIVAARTRMSVTQVTGKSELKPDCIYVIPPDRQLRIADGQISAEPFTEPRGARAPIDRLFRSLAEQHGDGFAIILTGAGSDGAVGVKAVKEAGGIILVQDPNEAEYPSMPQSAIATEVADFVLPIRGIASQIVELVGVKHQVASAQAAVDRQEGLRRILAQVRVRTGHDFQHYKRSTVMRRVLRRMQVTRRDTLEAYAAFLREDAGEAQALLADLLISVTTFFRDPKAFEALAQKIVPRLLREADPNAPIRVWSVGCATGEEAYSLGMLLLEEAQRQNVGPEIQVFGSDMDARALAIAREGRYPAAIEADVSEERLRRFFTREDAYYRVRRELRDIVLFASHSVFKDPPFSRMGLISCRNLLIYLDRDLQQRVLATLHYALTPDGFLMLGTSETADHGDSLFRQVDRDARLYEPSGRRPELAVLPRLIAPDGLDRAPAAPSPPPVASRGAQGAHREALESLAPPSILVDHAHRTLHLSESAGRYLQPSGGPLTADVVDLVRQELRFELRAALERALEHGETSLTPTAFVRFNGGPHRVYMQVRPVGRRGSETPRQAIILFIEGGPDPVGDLPPRAEADGQPDAERLKQELEAAQSRLRTMREESEAANEELRAANEELQSINEEYRSTAEELETSKEELQSINEELQTVNSELKLKLDTVSRANSDLQNLMAAMDFGTLFLDADLKINRFTPRLAELFSITPGDVGRPITDFAHQLDYEDLAADARKVLADLVPIEREIGSRDGRWYLARFRPYRTVDDRIDGVVATFVDVTERRAMEDALRQGEQRLRQQMRLVEQSRSPIFIWDFDSGVAQWNRGSAELYGYGPEEAVGARREALLQTAVPGASFAAVRRALLDEGAWQGEMHELSKAGEALIVEAQLELFSAGRSRLVLESARDITQSKALETRQRLLLSELTHRVRNVLTVVQGVVHQTWRGGDREDFLTRIDGRIGAMAEAHRLLVESDWRGADMRRLAETQLATVPGEVSGRLALSGPIVVLPPDLATPLGMVIHELATNAVKYGAFASDSGRVDLDWSIDRANGGSTLEVEWREQDGPPVEAPSRSGFGSRLIRQGLPGANVRHEFLADGVRCVIRVPLPERAEEGGHGQA